MKTFLYLIRQLKVSWAGSGWKNLSKKNRKYIFFMYIDDMCYDEEYQELKLTWQK